MDNNEFEHIKKQNSEEIHDYKLKKKKVFKNVIIVVIAVLIILYLIVTGLSWVTKRVRENNQREFEESISKGSLIFYPADYNENIFENKAYMDLNRGIWYTKAELSYYLTEEDDYSKYSYEFAFMANAINQIIRGDAKGYYSNFVENFELAQPDYIIDEFPMQKLYNIEVEVVNESQSEVQDSDDGMFYYLNVDYKVSYMIYHNTGTFRNDLPEEAQVPIVYKLWAKYKSGTTIPFDIKIYEVIDYSKYMSGLY